MKDEGEGRADQDKEAGRDDAKEDVVPTANSVMDSNVPRRALCAELFLRAARSCQATSLDKRLIELAEQLRMAADGWPPGKEREEMTCRARQAETGFHHPAYSRRSNWPWTYPFQG